jgi:hypothetical protein
LLSPCGHGVVREITWNSGLRASHDDDRDIFDSIFMKETVAPASLLERTRKRRPQAVAKDLPGSARPCRLPPEECFFTDDVSSFVEAARP